MGPNLRSDGKEGPWLGASRPVRWGLETGAEGTCPVILPGPLSAQACRVCLIHQHYRVALFCSTVNIDKGEQHAFGGRRSQSNAARAPKSFGTCRFAGDEDVFATHPAMTATVLLGTALTACPNGVVLRDNSDHGAPGPSPSSSSSLCHVFRGGDATGAAAGLVMKYPNVRRDIRAFSFSRRAILRVSERRADTYYGR